MVILSYIQVMPAFAAWDAGLDRANLSLDLGLTMSEVAIDAGGITLTDGQRLSWDALHEIKSHDMACFTVQESTIEKVQRFSPALNRFYSLMPTSGPPTFLVAGFPMHRIKGMNPAEDTQRKIKAAAPVRGVVLDTTTGLGYTAIAAAKTAKQVITVEHDATVLDIARLNPWSQALFEQPNIQQVIGNSYEYVQELADATFNCILHDPPIFQLAGELYSSTIYQHFLRVLKSGGRLFHYIGNPDSKSGQGVTRGAIRRLKEAGFDRVIQRPEAFGVVAHKA